MAHDQHFLSRLERLDREHAEIALGLYYDRALVRHLLRVANIPDDADRVALCLGAGEDGPFAIVARDGGFVTCLGEGMQLREGQAVIARHRLDTISESVESLRSLVADASAGGRRQTRRKLERVVLAGSGLSQEEFDDLARWLPVLAVDFLRLHVDIVAHCHDLCDRLARYKKLGRRHDELLQDYWRSTWAVAHLTMLLGSDGGGRLRGLLGVLEPEFPGAGMQLPWSLIRLGVTSFSARGAWVGSKLPSFVVPVAKRRYVDEQATFLTSLTDGLSLAAVGLRRRRYQAEVRKTLAKVAPPPDGISDYLDVIRGFAAVYFDVHVLDPDQHSNHLIANSRTLLRHAYAHLDKAHVDALDQLDSDIAVAFFLSMPHNIHAGPDPIRALFGWLPWIVGVEARSFYLPEPFVALTRVPWRRNDGLLLFNARADGGVHRPKPIVAAPKIGRNAACPCGSGQKYKRCCGGPGQPNGAST